MGHLWDFSSSSLGFPVSVLKVKNWLHFIPMIHWAKKIFHSVGNSSKSQVLQAETKAEVPMFSVPHSSQLGVV